MLEVMARVLSDRRDNPFINFSQTRASSPPSNRASCQISRTNTTCETSKRPVAAAAVLKYRWHQQCANNPDTKIKRFQQTATRRQGNTSASTKKRRSDTAMDLTTTHQRDMPGEKGGKQEAEGHDGQRNGLQPQENQPLIAVSEHRSPHHQKDKDVRHQPLQ